MAYYVPSALRSVDEHPFCSTYIVGPGFSRQAFCRLLPSSFYYVFLTHSKSNGFFQLTALLAAHIQPLLPPTCSNIGICRITKCTRPWVERLYLRARARTGRKVQVPSLGGTAWRPLRGAGATRPEVKPMHFESDDAGYGRLIALKVWG